MIEPPPDTLSDRPGTPLDLARLTDGLWRSRWWLLTALAVGAALGYLLLQVALEPDYQADAAIVWEPSDIKEAAAQHRMLRTLAASIELRETLEAVRQRAKLDMSVDDMAKAIIPDVRANSNLLRVYTRLPDPVQAANLANTIVEVFIEKQREALAEQVAEIVDSAKRIRDAALQELYDARKAYDDFRAKEGILDLRAERTAAIEKAAMLETTADHARADLEAQSERVRVLDQARKRIGETVVMSETEMAPGALALAKARAELEQLRGVLTEDHPRIQALAAEVKTLERTLESDLQPVVGQRVVARHPQRDTLENGLIDAEAARQAASKREHAYQEMMASTKRELEELIELEGKAAALITVLELAEKRYADAEAAVGRAHDIARTKTTGLRPASPAIPPLEPMPGRRRLLFAAAVPLLCMFLMALLLLVFRLRILRASSSKEVAFWGNGPVVAISPWPTDKAARDELRDELARPLDECPGPTLLVPYSPAEAPLAEEIGQALGGHIETVAEGGRKRSKPAHPVDSPDPARAAITVWPAHGSATGLRRACRRAGRVLVVIGIRRHSHFSLYGLTTRLGRKDGVGFVVVDVHGDLARMPDRVGDVEGFWSRYGTPATSGEQQTS